MEIKKLEFLSFAEARRLSTSNLHLSYEQRLNQLFDLNKRVFSSQQNKEILASQQNPINKLK